MSKKNTSEIVGVAIGSSHLFCDILYLSKGTADRYTIAIHTSVHDFLENEQSQTVTERENYWQYCSQREKKISQGKTRILENLNLPP